MQESGILFINMLPIEAVCMVRLPPTDFVLHFSSNFHENHFMRSQVCRVALVKSALESFDPGAFNGGLNVEIGPLEVVLNTSKVVELLQNLKKIIRINSNYSETRTFQK